MRKTLEKTSGTVTARAHSHFRPNIIKKKWKSCPYTRQMKKLLYVMILRTPAEEKLITNSLGSSNTKIFPEKRRPVHSDRIIIFTFEIFCYYCCVINMEKWVTSWDDECWLRYKLEIDRHPSAGTRFHPYIDYNPRSSI